MSTQPTGRRMPHDLWAQADSEHPGDVEARRERYLALMREHEHLIPVDPDKPCGRPKCGAPRSAHEYGEFCP
jgi:hypothetical protein